MKNILNGILPLIAISIVFIISFNDVEALEMNKKGKNLEVYQIKVKEEVLVEDNNILDFYKNNSVNQNDIEEKSEQEIIEESKDLSLQNEIVNFALQFVGNPYVSGGTSLTNGADCSGFVQSVFAYYGIYLPRTTYEQATVGMGVSIDEAEIGDIISYGYDGYVTHSALYVGDGMILHASTPELGIRVDSMYIMPIITIRRVI